MYRQPRNLYKLVLFHDENMRMLSIFILAAVLKIDAFCLASFLTSSTHILNLNDKQPNVAQADRYSTG